MNHYPEIEKALSRITKIIDKYEKDPDYYGYDVNKEYIDEYYDNIKNALLDSTVSDEVKIKNALVRIYRQLNELLDMGHSHDQIRELKNEGVAIGAHSHTHNHLANLTLEELRVEIGKSNKIFLKELGEIPNLFAYRYGETDEKFFTLLKDYKFKVAFGQHSGVIDINISDASFKSSVSFFLERFILLEATFFGK